ncbi:hypothetical protein FWC63_00730 [Candidatus Saccharibacteria bacterium]|nr:hypothetical protein [Candidatus Saccharibacteria bacterium]
MEIHTLLRSPAGKKIIIALGVITLIGLVIFIVVVSSRSTTLIGQNVDTEVYDPISGDTFREIDQPPEEPFIGAHLLGFGTFIEIGFSSQQSNIIFTSVREFFLERRPDITRLSVERGSIEYDVANDDITYFRLVANTEEVFRARVDIEGSMFRASLSFFDSSGDPID